MDSRHEKSPVIGAPGGGVIAAGAGASQLPAPIILPNVPTCQVPIPTAAGGPTAWAVADSLFTLRNVLEARGLDCPHSAIVEAWLAMGEASYLKKRDRRAWPEVEMEEMEQ